MTGASTSPGGNGAAMPCPDDLPDYEAAGLAMAILAGGLVTVVGSVTAAIWWAF